jgi:hypothetical protein
MRLHSSARRRKRAIAFGAVVERFIVSSMSPRLRSTRADSCRPTGTLYPFRKPRKSNPYARKTRDIAKLLLIALQSSISGASTLVSANTITHLLKLAASRYLR